MIRRPLTVSLGCTALLAVSIVSYVRAASDVPLPVKIAPPVAMNPRNSTGVVQ